MEWAVLALLAAIVAAYIAWPRPGDLAPDTSARAGELHAERRAILGELRDIDDDAVAGRITAEDRANARRALGPQLRIVTEALRDLEGS